MEHAFKEEFKALRDEIVATFARRATIQSVGTTLFAGLQSAAIITGNGPELSIIGTFLMIAFWNDDVKWLYDILRIGAYIRNVIEPRIYGLQWETVQMLVDQNHKEDLKGTSRLRMVVSRYPMTILMGLVLGGMLIMTCPKLSLMRAVLDILVLFLAIILSVRTFNRSVKLGTVNAEWDSIFRNAKCLIDAAMEKSNKCIQADAAEPRR